MTGLEPHPILQLPTREDALAGGEEWLQRVLGERAQALENEKADPFNFGFRPAIWDLCDDLLCDGNKIVLDASRLTLIQGRKVKVEVPKELTGRRELLIEGANRCLHGSTKIFDPVAGRERVIENIEGPFHVFAWDGVRPVIAKASRPFIKGRGPMLRIRLSNGAEFTVADTHVILACPAWKPCGRLTKGEQVFVCPLLSNSGNDLLVHAANVRCYGKREQDLPNDYRLGSPPRPVSGLEFGQSSFPLGDDRSASGLNRFELVAGSIEPANAAFLEVAYVESITKEPIADKWDISVDSFENYFVGGVIHHNSSKSEYAARKTMEVLCSTEEARTWSFADTGPISAARQQPLFFKYLPYEIKYRVQDTGKIKQGITLNVSYTQRRGFTDSTFVLPNKAQHWFKNYEQDIENVEGDKLHCVWFDELRNVDLLRTVRYRMGDFGGIIIVTFTAIDENYLTVVNEYEKGSLTVWEVDAPLLPKRGPKGEHRGFTKVPRVKIAGPGFDGNQRANIVYFHINDNPYFGYNGVSDKTQIFGADRFYSMFKGATKAKILSRVYGVLEASGANRFPSFNPAIHVKEEEQIPKEGTNYHVVDPCDGRNWFMLWIRVDPTGRWWVYREWPSHGHPQSYIPGIGEPGEWTLPGEPADGVPGPAQRTFSFGLDRYKAEIERLEGKERVEERWMDSRYGATPTTTREGSTTLIEQMREVGLEFLAASGVAIDEGVGLIQDLLDYDREVDLGVYSPTLSRLNEPKLFVSANCPNLIYALKEWTGKDKTHGACKDCIDALRYAVLARFDYINEEAYAWVGGGSY